MLVSPGASPLLRQNYGPQVAQASTVCEEGDEDRCPHRDRRADLHRTLRRLPAAWTLHASRRGQDDCHWQGRLHCGTLFDMHADTAFGVLLGHEAHRRQPHGRGRGGRREHERVRLRCRRKAARSRSHDAVMISLDCKTHPNAYVAFHYNRYSCMSITVIPNKIVRRRTSRPGTRP